MLSQHAARGGRYARALRPLVLLALVAGLVVAAPAGAVVVKKANGHRISILPSSTSSAKARFSCTTSCSPLLYHGGPVQHQEKDYLLFWSPSGHYTPPAYKQGLKQWLQDVARGDYTPNNVFSLNQEFYDNSGSGGAKRFVPYGIVNGGVLNDTQAYPASSCSDTDAFGNPMPICLTDAQISAEVQRYATANGLPLDMRTQYMVLTPDNVGSCFDSSSSQCAYTTYCAYHSYGGSGSSTFLYANMPWATNVEGCDVNLAFGTGMANADGLDSEVGVLSHEMSETMTDPQLNAWYDSVGNENGDKCAYTYGPGGYGSMSGLSNNGLGYWNQLMNGDEYLMQQEFSNRVLDCLSKDTDTQPTLSSVTVSPPSPTHGSSATFTATASAPSGIAYVNWVFGDGASATTTSLSTTHTYASAGADVLKVTVTDNHGNEKRVTQTVNVS